MNFRNPGVVKLFLELILAATEICDFLDPFSGVLLVPISRQRRSSSMEREEAFTFSVGNQEPSPFPLILSGTALLHPSPFLPFLSSTALPLVQGEQVVATSLLPTCLKGGS